jgi:hypothetical protein
VSCSSGTSRVHTSVHLLLRDSGYVKHFCNARNAISYIQDIRIINAFHDGVSDVKTVEEIAVRKPRTMADLLVVADVCIAAFKA